MYLYSIFISSYNTKAIAFTNFNWDSDAAQEIVHVTPLYPGPS